MLSVRLYILIFLAGTSAYSQPAIAPGGVVNAADYSPAIAPGSLIAIYGQNFATAVVSASTTPLPTVLGGTSVEVNGTAIPLFFVSADQINAQMPFGLPTGNISVRVRSGGTLSGAATVAVAPVAPRFFTRTQDGRGDPILLRATDWTLASNPAPGDYLIAFLTGLGAVSPAIAAGQPAGDNGANGPLNLLPAGSVRVVYGGQPALVLFAGLAPGFAGLYQINFQVPASATGNRVVVQVGDAATTDTTLLAPPTAISATSPESRTVGSATFGSSTKLNLSWTAPAGYSVDHYRIAASESDGSVAATARATAVTLTGLKAATEYGITVTACADAACRQSGTAARLTATTSPEYWQLQGSGNSTAGLTRIVSDGNARISATRFGPEGAPIANRVQLYYGPRPTPGAARQILATALSTQATTDTPASFLSFTSTSGRTGLISPATPTSLVSIVATGQGVPLTTGKVRLFFEAQGSDNKTRIFSLDSADGYAGQDFHSGSATVCEAAADYGDAGGCKPTLLIGVEGDATKSNARIPNARQHKLGFPTQTDWRWDQSPGTFLVFTTDRINNCSNSGMNHGYAVWDGASFQVQYRADGCPKLFTSAQAAFPMHVGGVRYKMYYGDPSITTGRNTGNNLPFLGPKKLIYADGAISAPATQVDFEDWESQSKARDVIFLWPNGDKLNDSAEGYIDDYHFLAPTGSLNIQVMYMAITNGTEVPFAAAALLLNP